jgi:hypothetical protein
MISEINDWLKNPKRKFSDGVSLYKKYGNSETLKNLFSHGENIYSREELFNQLKELRGELPLSPKAIKVEQEFKIFSETKFKKINHDELPDRLKELNIRRGILYREMSFTGAQMRALPEGEKYDEQRRKYAERICRQMEPALDYIWKELNYFSEHKKELPEEERMNIEILLEENKPDVLPKDKFLLMRKRASIASMRTRAKNDKALFKKYDDEIRKIDELLNE